MRIATLGAPGSGKKTQTSLLADNYQLTVLTVSKLIKQAISEESERGVQLRQLQQAGQPVTDDIVLSLLQQRLSQSDLSSGFILDGFPRNLLQALTLDELLSEMGLNLDFVLLFEIEADALMERLVGRRTCRSCGALYNIYTQPTAVDDVCDLCGGRLHQRADDTEETVSGRLHVFDHLTVPLLSHYGKQEKLLRVDGEGEVDAVFAQACRMIDGFLAERAAEEATDEPSILPKPATEASSDLSAATPSAKEAAPGQRVSKQETGKVAVKAKSAAKKGSGSKSGSRKPAAKKPAQKKPAAKKAVKKKPVAKKAVKKKPAAKRPATAKARLKQSAPAKKVTKKTIS